MSALEALFAASLAIVPAPAPVNAPAAVEPLKEILRVPMDSIDRSQARAASRQAAGGGTVEAAVGFDGQAELWFKLRSGSRADAWRPAQLADPVSVDLGFGPLNVQKTSNAYRVWAAAKSPEALFYEKDLLDAVYTRSLRVTFPPVEYVILHENGDPVSGSLCLLRQAQDGTYWVTYNTLEQAKKLIWFLSVNGLRHAMRLEGTDVVFYTRSGEVPPPGSETALERRVGR